MIAKNTYITSTEIANAVKHQYFNVDLPALHDHFQSIWNLLLSRVVQIMLQVCTMRTNLAKSSSGRTERIVNAINAVNINTDQTIYVKFNTRPWFEPPNVKFEPCSFWHDTDQIDISNPDSKVHLQNSLAVANKSTFLYFHFDCIA